MRVKDGRGGFTRTKYDLEGHILEVTSPTGVLQQLSWDAEGNLLEAKDATRHVRFRYGGFHKLVAREEAGALIRFENDTEGQLTAVINEAGERYEFVLGGCGRVLTETGFDGVLRVYQRDSAGQVTKTWRSSGRTTDIAYDLAGRLLKVKHSDGTGAEFEYRKDGALVRAKNESAEVLFERDALGRVLKESVGDEWVSSQYALDGQRCALETSLRGRMAVEHDALGEVEKLRIGADPFWESVIRFERDAEGLEVGRALPGGVQVSWTRDQAGRPLERRTSASKGDRSWNLDVRHYDWRGEDQIEALTDLARGRTAYEHDARGRLIAQHGPGGVLHRAMDAVGNIYRIPERTDRRYGRGGRLEVSDGVRYEHDEDGNQTKKVEPDGSTWRYNWSGAGLLSSVDRPDGKRVQFEYDAFARRTLKTLVTVDKDGTELIEAQTRFVWDGNVVVHEVDTQGEVTTWHWEPGTFTPVAKERGDRRWTIASDHLGTPTEMYDEVGRIAWQMRMDVFGAPTFEVGKPEDCPWRWPGQYEDAETGLFSNRYRYYDHEAGRYITTDPIGLAGGAHLYRYPADPTSKIDPLGLTCTAARELPGRSGALNQAKRDLGLPRSQHPDSVSRVPMTDRNGNRILNESRQPIMTREYTYTRPDGSKVVIQDHSAGHRFGQGGVGDQGPHFNVRPPENTRTGSVPGAQDHYLFGS